jgi:ABC-type bacteriocin/lantibiotic exporter with double-glycine peptidase domain
MRANFNSFEVLESDLINSSSTKTNFFKTDDLKKLSLDNINFSYSNKKLFNNFSYEFKVGNIYGIVGESGSGKSSLLKIIMGFISPNSGKVKINDIPIKDSWLKDVSYVSQQNIILNASLGQNIDINYNGNEKMRIKIINLLKSLGLDLYLKEIDYNLDHVISEKGSNISGGQLQRISIARALYIESKLIIFDEATSALDNYNQKLLMNILKKLETKSIVIISTHRKETLDFCDFIIKL